MPLALLAEILGVEPEVRHAPARPGDQRRTVADLPTGPRGPGLGAGGRARGGPAARGRVGAGPPRPDRRTRRPGSVRQGDGAALGDLGLGGVEVDRRRRGGEGRCGPGRGGQAGQPPRAMPARGPTQSDTQPTMRPADRRAAEEDHGLEGQHPAPQLGCGPSWTMAVDAVMKAMLAMPSRIATGKAAARAGHGGQGEHASTPKPDGGHDDVVVGHLGAPGGPQRADQRAQAEDREQRG